MKKLDPTGKTLIPSNKPRTRRGPDSRGIRICVQELGRSCSLKQGFITFTDGSAYSYDSPSNTEMEDLCDNLRRGLTFNEAVRRSFGGYTRGFSPPSDYETIYVYPPYDGTKPDACGLGRWSAWVNLSGAGTGNIVSQSDGQLAWDTSLIPPSPADDYVDSYQLFWNNTTVSIHMHAEMSYTVATVMGYQQQVAVRIQQPLGSNLAADSQTVPPDPNSGNLVIDWDVAAGDMVYLRVQVVNTGSVGVGNGSMLCVLS